MKRTTLATLLILLLVGFSIPAHAENGNISAKQAYEYYKNPNPNTVFLDIRTPKEYQENHIKDAVLIDFYSMHFETTIANLDRQKMYIMYCRTGYRCKQGLELMTELGFTDVSVIEDGITEWIRQGFPVETVKH